MLLGLTMSRCLLALRSYTVTPLLVGTLSLSVLSVSSSFVALLVVFIAMYTRERRKNHVSGVSGANNGSRGERIVHDRYARNRPSVDSSSTKNDKASKKGGGKIEEAKAGKHDTPTILQ